jgi:translation initiation factor 1 (eIF-1/SUI1)
MPIDNDALVYSTEHGDLRQRQPSALQGPALPPSQQTAFIHRTSKGRGGKVVTLVKNLLLSPDDHKALTKHLKQTCGSGGDAQRWRDRNPGGSPKHYRGGAPTFRVQDEDGRGMTWL